MYNMQYGSQQQGDVQPVRELLLRPDREALAGTVSIPLQPREDTGPRADTAARHPAQMMGGPMQSSSSEGPQQSMWATRNDMPYPTRTGKARAAPRRPRLTGMNRTDDMMVPDQRINHESQWPSTSASVSLTCPHQPPCSPSRARLSRPTRRPPSLPNPNHISRRRPAPPPSSAPGDACLPASPPSSPP